MGCQPAETLATAAPSPGAGVRLGELRLQASGPSWVEVRSLEGESLYGAILQGQVLLPLGRGVKVLAGRPDLVRVSVAGQRPKVLGRIDQIAWVEVPLREGMAPP
jgi:cytoskeleton protein RodZ